MKYPVEHTEETNARILAVSEDMLQGFVERPFTEIAQRTKVGLEEVCGRICAMLDAGVIRRVRQTLLTTRLAEGALVAWQVDEENLDEAFDFMAKKDPFSGHVVVRSTDAERVGSGFKLWTTLKVPVGESLVEHCDVLKNIVGAHKYVLMPAKGVFTLGVGHVRRRQVEPGSRANDPAQLLPSVKVILSDVQWRVLLALKRELALDEINDRVWQKRAMDCGVSEMDFLKIAHDLDKKKVIGRFSTFLEHVKPSEGGQRVTKFNGLFHWAVPKGKELEAGGEVGRHDIITHCYWREAGEEFGNVNIMAVAHGMEKVRLLEHKQAIDEHLREIGLDFGYTNIFWGGRSEIKPSEIDPEIFRKWHKEQMSNT